MNIELINPNSYLKSDVTVYKKTSRAMILESRQNIYARM
jgi:hypothetical protein